MALYDLVDNCVVYIGTATSCRDYLLIGNLGMCSYIAFFAVLDFIRVMSKTSITLHYKTSITLHFLWLNYNNICYQHLLQETQLIVIFLTTSHHCCKPLLLLQEAVRPRLPHGVRDVHTQRHGILQLLPVVTQRLLLDNNRVVNQLKKHMLLICSVVSSQGYFVGMMHLGISVISRSRRWVFSDSYERYSYIHLLS